MVIGGDVDIIGFNMNIAAKVQSMASPGKIVLFQLTLILPITKFI